MGHIGYATSGVRAIPLSDKKGGTVAEANYQNVLSGKYPLSSILYIYVAKCQEAWRATAEGS